MSIQPRAESQARWNVTRTNNRTMDREIYLDNDHLVDIRIEERTTGKATSGLLLTASLSRNPTGSAETSFFLDGGTSSLVAATSFSVETIQFIGVIPGQAAPPVTQSILLRTSQSLFTEFTGSISGSKILTASLVETPVCSGRYVGTIAGIDITTALSQSISASFSQSFTSSFTSTSFGSLIISAGLTASVAFTASVTGLTSSFTASNLVQLVESDDRCFGVFEIIESGSFLKASTPMTLRSARFIP